MNNETCSVCKFKLPNPQDLNQAVCRRNPPQVVVVPSGGGVQMQLTLQAHYPPIHNKQPACGEWLPKITIN